AIKAREKVSKLVNEDPYVLQMHGFNIDFEQKTMRFDIVVSFDAKDREAVYEAAVAKVQIEFPDYSIQAAMDLDLSEVD
ncbi:MAG: cation transporter, partial [Lachnospiraceae bacterium]|nr:cation transporter [Lachnospiraceae bacterium]